MRKNQVWIIIDETDQMKLLKTYWVFEKKNTKWQNVFHSLLVAKGLLKFMGKI